MLLTSAALPSSADVISRNKLSFFDVVVVCDVLPFDVDDKAQVSVGEMLELPSEPRV